jgi:hypothetical protein
MNMPHYKIINEGPPYENPHTGDETLVYEIISDEYIGAQYSVYDIKFDDDMTSVSFTVNVHKASEQFETVEQLERHQPFIDDVVTPIFIDTLRNINKAMMELEEQKNTPAQAQSCDKTIPAK